MSTKNIDSGFQDLVFKHCELWKTPGTQYCENEEECQRHRLDFKAKLAQGEDPLQMAVSSNPEWKDLLVGS